MRVQRESDARVLCTVEQQVGAPASISNSERQLRLYQEGASEFALWAQALERTHTGAYRVIARNEFGDCEESFSLAVLGTLRVRVRSRTHECSLRVLVQILEPPACTVQYTVRY